MFTKQFNKKNISILILSALYSGALLADNVVSSQALVGEQKIDAQENYIFNNGTAITSDKNGIVVSDTVSGASVALDDASIDAKETGVIVNATGGGNNFSATNSMINTDDAALYFSKNTAGTINLSNNTAIKSTNGDGIYLESDDASINIKGSDIQGKTSAITAINSSNPTIDISSSTLNTEGTALYYRFNTAGTVSLDNTTIKSTNGEGILFEATASSLNIKDSDMQGKKHGITAYGSNNSIIDIKSSDIQGEASAMDVISSSNLTINISDSALNGDDAGLYIKNQTAGTVNLDNTTIKTTNGDGIHLGGDKSSLSIKGSDIEGKVNAISIGGGSNVSVSVTDSILRGDIRLAGSVDSHAAFNITGATWAGGAVNSNINGYSDMVMTGSQWNITKDSVVDSLMLTDSDISMPQNQASTILTVKNDYAGDNARLHINTALGNDSSETDKLIIGGNASGKTDVIVNNLGGKGDQTVDGIEIVRVGGTSDAGAFYNSKAIRAGLYNYTVVRKDNNNFYLTSDYVVPGSTKPTTGINPVVTTAPNTKPATGINPVVTTAPNTQPATGGNPVVTTAPNTQPTTGSNPVVTPELFSLPIAWDLGKDISTAAGSYIANLAAANQAFVTRLADREGGSEYINQVTGQRDITRLWLRQEGGHNRSRADVLRTTSNRYVAQLGGELINGSFTDTDHWDFGLMAGYVNQQGTTTSLRSRYDVNTKSQLHGYSTGLYGTWYQDAEARTGLYVGTWAQYSWFRNSVNEDGQASDSYKSEGFSASLEAGYSWKVVDGERTDFFIQPQAQLVWTGIKADDHDTRSGIRVQGEGGNNLQSSLGVKAYLKGHSKLDDNTGRSFKPFVEANWIHNTARYGVRMDGDSLNQDGAKDIVEVKTGVENQLSASTSIWGGVGVQIGDKGYSDTQGQLGLKVRF